MDYFIHNVSRKGHSRVARAQAPAHRKAQFVLAAQKRLVRSRPLRISEEELLENLSSLQSMVKAGQICVVNQDQGVVDLLTLQESKVVISSPRPQFPLDSISRDRNGGVAMSINNQPPPAEFVMPVAPPDATVDEPIEDVVETEASEASEEEVLAALGMDSTKTSTSNNKYQQQRKGRR
jgi:hypothetical protein